MMAGLVFLLSDSWEQSGVWTRRSILTRGNELRCWPVVYPASVIHWPSTLWTRSPAPKDAMPRSTGWPGVTIFHFEQIGENCAVAQSVPTGDGWFLYLQKPYRGIRLLADRGRVKSHPRRGYTEEYTRRYKAQCLWSVMWWSWLVERDPRLLGHPLLAEAGLFLIDFAGHARIAVMRYEIVM